MLETRRRKGEGRQRSNRERGLAYRERQRTHEASLAQEVARLRGELDSLVRTRSLLLQTSVVSRNSAHGSLAQFMSNHYRILVHGFPDLFKTRSIYVRQSEQEIYIAQALDSDIVVGSGTGALAYMGQWQQFQRSFANINNVPRTIKVLGPEHDPTVVVHSELSARITDATFRYFFAYLGYKTDLVHKFVGREIVLPVTTRFYFSQDGRIRKLEPELDFVSAFFNAGASLSDLARLFQHSVLTMGYGNVMEPPRESAAAADAPCSVVVAPAVHEFIVPERPNSRTKSSISLGGKLLRRHQREYEQAHLDQINALKQQIGLLERKRSLMETQTLTTRGSSAGSLMKLVQYYLTLAKFGITSSGPINSIQRHTNQERTIQQARNQHIEAFLRQRLAPNATTGSLTGVEQLLAGWKALTSALVGFRLEILALSITGPDEDPIVCATAQYHAVVSEATFCVLFPSVALENPVVAKFMGKRVTIPMKSNFQFTADGRFLRTTTDLGLVEAFLNVGATIRDIAQLMEHSVITAESTFDPSALDL